MIVTYSPAGQEPQTWTWDPKTMRPAETEDIEAAMGTATKDVTIDEFQMLLMRGGARARRVLLWALQRRAHPTLKLADVDFALGELSVEFEAPELRRIREQVATAAGISEQQRATALDALDAELADKTAAADGPGKARSALSGNATA